jgi:small subunit ribosomal protein S17
LEKRGKRKLRTGVVLSSRMDKTAVVEVERVFQHSFYSKVVRASKKLKAHDEKNACNPGDLVEIMETRPLSRDKRWRVVRIIGKGKIRAHELPKRKEAKPEVEQGGLSSEIPTNVGTKEETS